MKQNTFRLTQTLGGVIAAAAVLSACVAPMQPTASPYPAAYPSGGPPPATYPSAAYPAPNSQGSYSEFGRVSNIEVLRTPEQGRPSGLGAVIGGVAGAVVGRQIGGGTGRDVATVAGALGGAVAGNAVERNRNAGVRESYRVSVQLDNGSARIYEVPSPGELRVGDRVRLDNGQISRL
jgi:outer membrane lipoprotein SlyB